LIIHFLKKRQQARASKEYDEAAAIQDDIQKQVNNQVCIVFYLLNPCCAWL